MSDYLTGPARSRWHDGVQIGTEYDASELAAPPLVALAGDVRMDPLAPMLVPEEPRRGKQDASECGRCRRGDRWIWADEHWHVFGARDTSLPWRRAVATNGHQRLDVLAENNRLVAAAMAQGGGEGLA